MKKKTSLAIVLVATLILVQAFSKFGSPNFENAYASTANVYVFVDQQIYTNISASLDQYVDDLYFEGYNVTVINVTESTDPQWMREDILANDPNAVGCLLVGHAPVVWYEYPSSLYPFATDYYFMDLDGNWIDADGDHSYDDISGEKLPEIWCGRIKGWGSNESEMINTYFGKAHKLRTGQLVFNQRALLYFDDDWQNSSMISRLEAQFQNYYDAVTTVNNSQMTNADDYKNRLRDGYEHISLYCHGVGGTVHEFKAPPPYNTTVWGNDYLSIDSRSFSINFYTCFAGRHTYVGDNPHYLAGSWIFAPTGGLIAVAPTEGNAMQREDWVYDSLFGEGRTVGEALVQWHINWQTIAHGFPNVQLVLAGDPTLRKPVVYINAQDQNGNSLNRGDVYVDEALYAYTNTTVNMWIGNHTVFIQDFWQYNATGYTCFRYKFLNWTDNSCNNPRNTTISSNMSLTATFNMSYCPGDVNGDAVVNMRDIAIVTGAYGAYRGISAWDTSPKWDSRADTFCDNIIDMRDVSHVTANFGRRY